MAAVRELLPLDLQSCCQIVIWSVTLAFVCLLGDRICAAVAESSLVWRALSDNVTHGAVGMMSWAVVTLPGLTPRQWMWCLFCGLLSSVIDFDHFVQAWSLQLKECVHVGCARGSVYLHLFLHLWRSLDAVSLQHRPPLHSTTLVLATTGLLWVASLGLDAPLLKKVSLMCFVAWFSHQLRDSTRRGLWFPPFGSSPPLPYACYVISTVLVALAVCFVWRVALSAVAEGTFQAADLASVSLVE